MLFAFCLLGVVCFEVVCCVCVLFVLLFYLCCCFWMFDLFACSILLLLVFAVFVCLFVCC